MNGPNKYPNPDNPDSAEYTHYTSNGQAIETGYRNREGTDITGSRLLGDARTDMQDAISAALGYDVTVAGTNWVFTGEGYNVAAAEVSRVANVHINHRPDELGDIGTVQVPGTRNGEDSVTLVLASASIDDPAHVDQLAATLADRVDISFELSGVDIHLPQPPEEL